MLSPLSSRSAGTIRLDHDHSPHPEYTIPEHPSVWPGLLVLWLLVRLLILGLLELGLLELLGLLVLRLQHDLRNLDRDDVALLCLD